MTEKQLEQKLVAAVYAEGGIAYKFTSPGRTGVPDRIVILPAGRVGFVEVKKPKVGKLSNSQKFELRRLSELGCKCFVLDSERAIDLVIEAIKDE